MKGGDFPPLQRAASAAARTAQRRYRLLTWAALIGAVGTAGLAVIGHWWPEAIVWDALFILVASAILARVLNRRLRPDRIWFDARAVSESMRAATWRYVTRARPFDGEPSDDVFLARLQEILSERPELRLQPASGPQITAPMRALRGGSLDERRGGYLDARAEHQLGYYRRRASGAEARGNAAFVLGLGTEVGLFVAAFLLAAGMAPNLVGLFSSLVGAVVGWSQLGQYDELARAYALTAQELSLISDRLGLAADEAAFVALVDETESVISREHTLWAIKRGTRPP